MENTNSFCKTGSKIDNQQRYKDIVEEEIVSTTEGFTDNSLMTHNPYVSTKIHSARKPLCQFSETLDVKHNTVIRQPEQSKCCGKTLQITMVIKKGIKIPDKPFTVLFYIILRLCNLQWKMIFFVYLLMTTMKNN